VIAVIDYEMGNVGSVLNMLRKIRIEAKLTRDPRDLDQARGIILPGVGSFDRGMEQLRKHDLIAILTDLVVGDGKPCLGICLGMQLMCMSSEEGKLDGLGWLRAKVVRFKFGKDVENHKIPHMGWNSVQIQKGNRLLLPNPEENRFYFVHSYHVACDEEGDIVGTTNYGYNFTSIFSKDNIYGVQFHPEKSHRFGIGLISNFTALG